MYAHAQIEHQLANDLQHLQIIAGQINRTHADKLIADLKAMRYNYIDINNNRYTQVTTTQEWHQADTITFLCQVLNHIHQYHPKPK